MKKIMILLDLDAIGLLDLHLVGSNPTSQSLIGSFHATVALVAGLGCGTQDGRRKTLSLHRGEMLDERPLSITLQHHLVRTQ